MHEPGTALLRNSALGILAFCFVSFNVAQAQTWKTYSYPVEGFSASYPAQPSADKKDVPTEAGTFQLRSYMVETEPATFYIGLVDYGSAASGGDPQERLQGAKNGALTNSNSHLVREKKVTLGVYPGLDFEAESSAAHFYARIYWVGTTIYQTVVVTPLGKPSDDTVRFLDSFQLIARVSN